MARCMGNDTMGEDYPDEKQRAAVCHSAWRKEHGGEAPQERAWFSVRAEAGEPPEVYIYDEIGRGFFGGGVSADAFVREVKSLKLKPKDELLVRINSPGGDVFDGIAIYNYLRGTKHAVRVRVDGVAASAASMIAMAGDTVEMPETAYLMIHNPWMMTIGDAAVMRKAAQDLDVIGEAAINGYLRKAGSALDRAQLIAMLDAETWIPATQAHELGLADVVLQGVKAAALRMKWSDLPYRVPAALARTETARVDLAAERARLRSLGWSGRPRNTEEQR